MERWDDIAERRARVRRAQREGGDWMWWLCLIVVLALVATMLSACGPSPMAPGVVEVPPAPAVGPPARVAECSVLAWDPVEVDYAGPWVTLQVRSPQAGIEVERWQGVSWVPELRTAYSRVRFAAQFATRYRARWLLTGCTAGPWEPFEVHARNPAGDPPVIPPPPCDIDSRTGRCQAAA